MICYLCHFTIESQDDVAVKTPGGRYICCRCWYHDTADERRMDAELRRELESVLGRL